MLRPEGDGRTDRGVAIAWAAYSFDIFPVAAAVHPYMANLLFFALALGIAITGMIFRYTTRIPGAGVELRGPADAGVVRDVSDLSRCRMAANDRVDAADRRIRSKECVSCRWPAKDFRRSHFWWGSGLNAIYFVLAVAFFLWIFEKARSRGLLVKQE